MVVVVVLAYMTNRTMVRLVVVVVLWALLAFVVRQTTVVFLVLLELQRVLVRVDLKGARVVVTEAGLVLLVLLVPLVGDRIKHRQVLVLALL